MGLTWERQLQLIDIYKKKDVLWNPNHELHFHKRTKQKAWMHIGYEVCLPVRRCKNKILFFRNYYRRERYKVENSKSKITGRPGYKSKWFAYEALKFLDDVMNSYYPLREPLTQRNPSTSGYVKKRVLCNPAKTISTSVNITSPKKETVERLEININPGSIISEEWEQERNIQIQQTYKHTTNDYVEKKVLPSAAETISTSLKRTNPSEDTVETLEIKIDPGSIFSEEWEGTDTAVIQIDSDSSLIMSSSTDTSDNEVNEDDIGSVIQIDSDSSLITSSSTDTSNNEVNEDDIGSVLETAFDILKTEAKESKKTPSTPDEIGTLFNYCAAKMHKYSPNTKKAVEHAILDIIMKADSGVYD